MTETAKDLTKNPQIETSQGGESIFNGLMLWAAARCGLQYVVLPFLLPFVRLSESVSVWANILISVLAIAVMGRNIWRLWNTHWRVRYIVWSVIAISIIAFFLYSDFTSLAK